MGQDATRSIDRALSLRQAPGPRVDPDATAIAAPVRDVGGAAIGALSVIAPSYRIGDDAVRQVGEAVAAHATALSGELGAPVVAGVAR